MGDVSRRGFLKGAGAGAMAAAAATGIGAVGLAGCAKEEAQPEAKQYPYTVHDSDVVIIGSGLSGLHAAWAALEEGATVTIVDKGRYAHSGNSGMNWGNMFAAVEDSVAWATAQAMMGYGYPPEMAYAAGEAQAAEYVPTYLTTSKFATGHDGILDQHQAMLVEKVWQERRPTRTYEQLGGVLERTKDGNPAQAGNAAAGLMPRLFAQKVARMGVHIEDRMFAQSLLFNADKTACVGIVALSLRDGTAHVFRANSVIVAAGSYIWACGWNGMRPHTHGSADLTGEGLAFFLQAGLPMVDCEIQEHDLSQYTPLTMRDTVCALGSQTTSWPWSYNNKGELFMQQYVDAGIQSGQGNYMRATLKEINEGRGSEHGGVYVDTTDMDRIERFWRRSKDDEYRTLGYKMADREECTAHFWADGMRPADMTDNFETKISGLYFAGEAIYTCNGGSTQSCIGTGWLSGKGAAAKKGQGSPEVNWDDVQAALAKAYGPLEAETTDKTMTPLAVMREVQDAYWEYVGLIRNEEGLRKGIEELERIKAEDLAKMACRDKSPVMNADWKASMEVGGMLDDCLACAYAALERKCSRGVSFVRTDYPNVGNELYNTVTTMDAEGKFTVTTRPVVDEYVPVATLLEEKLVDFGKGIA